MLVFEDLHSADEDLLDFVDELVDWIEDVPLLVVATARPELLDRRPGWGGGKRNAVTLSLAPLTDDDTARLIAELLDRSLLPAETQQSLLARAGGNPLYAEQFARMFVERGEALSELPETVQGIIAARLDSLLPEEKSLLFDAAVLGKTFWIGALQADDAEARLRALQRKEFVRRERRSSVAGETEFAFTHLLVRDVAYAQIPRAERAVKHVRAAQWIESLAGDRAEDLAEQLAHHYVAALELRRAAGADTDELAHPAARALVAAAERAAGLSAYAQAEGFATKALALAKEGSPTAARAQHWLAWAGYNLGRAGAETRAVEAATAFRELGDAEAAAESEMLAALCFWHRGLGDEADQASERARVLVRDAPTSHAKATVLVERSRLLMLRGRNEEAVAIGREGLALAEELGIVHLQVSALVSVGTALGARLGEGIAELERALELGRGGAAPPETQRAFNNLAQEMLSNGRARETKRLYDEARAEVDRFGLLMGIRWLTPLQASVSYFLGDWERADALLKEYEAAIADAESHVLQTQMLQTRAAMALARGDSLALDYAQQSLAHARRSRTRRPSAPRSPSWRASWSSMDGRPKRCLSWTNW